MIFASESNEQLKADPSERPQELRIKSLTGEILVMNPFICKRIGEFDLPMIQNPVHCFGAYQSPTLRIAGFGFEGQPAPITFD
jgi:hypothetical protein